MTAQGEIVRFQGKIINDEGQTEPSEIVRVGPFTALADGEFLRYAGDGRFIKLGRQPPSRFLGAAGDLDGTDSDEMGVGVIDPSRGAILNLFLQTPTLFERIGQGGLVGYIIILLGLFGAGLACERILTLTRLSKKVQAQLETGSKEEDTPLGRVWAVYEANKMANTETIGLKLDDAILKEMPALEKRANYDKTYFWDRAFAWLAWHSDRYDFNLPSHYIIWDRRPEIDGRWNLAGFDDNCFGACGCDSNTLFALHCILSLKGDCADT